MNLQINTCICAEWPMNTRHILLVVTSALVKAPPKLELATFSKYFAVKKSNKALCYM